MQIDGLANNNDVFFREVVNDSVHLLFSTDADHGIIGETPGAAVGVGWAYGQPPYVPGVNRGNNLDQHGVNDLDGLEIWGPSNPEAPDADRFSLESGTHTGSGDPLGVAVWDSPGPGGPAIPHWTTAEIALAILFASDINVGIDEVDLDAMMNGDGLVFLDAPGTLDHLMFSIDPILNAAGGGLLFDGGEIFVAHRTGGVGTFGAAGDTAHYLFHGGHLWNTEFEVMATYNTASENINALEAANIPEPATWGIAVLGLAGIGMARRWQRSG